MDKTPIPAKPKQPRRRYMLVRYGRMRLLGLFEHNEGNLPSVPTRVVVKTEKGLELGSIIGQLSSYKAGQLKIPDEQLKEYYEDSEVEYSPEPAGRFVRFATPEDVSEERHFQKIAQEEADYCRQLVAEMNLPMKVVDAEHILGGERIIFYFMADGRVDFRELVRRLAQEYQTRIEMRQIGSRDEAKILGDIETCGQVCCCIRFLKALKPVNMRMAKLQKATLDPSKISGYCGRLKCCLRYEDQTYTELKKLLPRKNTEVRTKFGSGRVLDVQVLAQLVAIEREDGTTFVVPGDEIEIIGEPHAPPQTGESGSREESDDSGAKPQNEEQKTDENNPVA